MTVEDIVVRLDHRFTLLTRGNRQLCRGRCKDPDGMFATANHTTLAPPGLEAGNACRGRALHEDQQGIVEAVLMKAGLHAQPGRPGLRVCQLGDACREASSHLATSLWVIWSTQPTGVGSST